jgi:ribosomal protein L40E
LSSNPVIVILGIVFGALAAGLVLYGKLRAPPVAVKQQPKPVTMSVTKPQKTEARAESSDYFCHKCYAFISPDLEFCSECGEKQT